MLSKFKEAAHNQVVLVESSKDTDAKVMFLLRVIQLNPENLRFYSERMFKNEGYTLQLLTFLLDCLNYSTLHAVKNYKIAGEIF